MKLLALVTTLLLLATQGQAKVVVYKGTLTTKTGPVNIEPALATAFLLLDTETTQISFFLLFKKDGEKTQQADFPLPIQLASAPIQQGRTATILSLSISTSAADSFTNGLFYIRGTNSTLSVASSGLTTLNLPRLLNGFIFRTGSTETSDFFQERKLALAYQEGRTIKANDAGQTIANVVDGLSKEFEALGFKGTSIAGQ